MSISHTIKRTWSTPAGATPISYQVTQAGNVEANLDVVVAGGVNLQSAIAITRATLQSFFLVSSQSVSIAVGGLDSIQTLTLGGTFSPTDDFTLTWSGQTTGNIAMDATAATVQAALEALSNIGAGNVAVTGPAGGPWVVEFVGALGLAPRAAITDVVVSGTGTMTITQTQVGVAPTQTIALAAGVPIEWTKDDVAANPLTGNVAKLSVYNPGTATAVVDLRSLYN